MNADDQAYYAELEFQEKTAKLERALTELRDRGIRIRMRGDAGSVAVNAFGEVTDVCIDTHNAEYISEDTLAKYLAEALHVAERRARTARDELLNYETLEVG